MEKKTKEKTVEESLKDDTFFRYNLLFKIEENNRLIGSILEILGSLYQRVIQEEKQQKEGTFKSK